MSYTINVLLFNTTLTGILGASGNWLANSSLTCARSPSLNTHSSYLLCLFDIGFINISVDAVWSGKFRMGIPSSGLAWHGCVLHALASLFVP